MQGLLTRAAVLIAVAIASSAPLPASAVEEHTYHGQGGFTGAFTVAGGQYSIYVDAHFLPNSRTHSPDSCIFVGDLKRVSPTQDSLRLGTEVPVRNPIHYKLGPAPLALPTGRYQLFVASMSDCEWTFSLEGSVAKAAGLEQINLYSVGDTVAKVEGTSIGGTLEFNAQYGLGNAQTPPTGTMQLLHGGQVMETHPLTIGRDPETHAPSLFVSLRFEASDAKLVGQNVARFIVKIGNSTYTQSRPFTLSP
jgi:hypothetical protein